MTGGDLNLEWARRIVGALVEMGLAEAELAPGSRSAALALAMAEFPELRVRVHLDERSAGFFALGYGRRARRPAAVVTTSGTAVANLLPSVVEAAASDVPVILLTADRPARLRGADANQTIDQVGIFGPALRWEADLPAASEAGLAAVGEAARTAFAYADGPPAGPVHLNIPFEKPLEPESAEAWRRGLRRGGAETRAGRGRSGDRAESVGAAGRGAEAGRGESDRRSAGGGRGRVVGASPEAGRSGLGRLRASEAAEAAAGIVERALAVARRPVLVAGPSSDPDAEGPALSAFAARLGVPLLADPLSGARFGAGAAQGHRPIGAYDHFLRLPGLVERLAPDLVLRTGRTPTSAVLEDAVARWSGARQVVVDAGGQPKDHQGLADDYLRAAAGPVLDRVGRAGNGAGPRRDDGGWVDEWGAVEGAAWDAVEDGLAWDAANEGAYAAALLGALPAGATLFVSSSMPVRDVDAFGRPGPLGIRLLGNRGANGIDGIVSSAFGCAAAGDEPVACLLGDLALYHDLNGLLAARDGDLGVVFVVVDNDGGGIFHLLPIRDFEPAFTPCFGTPHGLDFRHAARLHGIPFADVGSPAELADAARSAADRRSTRIVRVRTDPVANRLRHEAARARVAQALQGV